MSSVPAEKSPNPSDAKVAAEPSGINGGNPSTAGPGNTKVDSPTPENNKNVLNPSAPGNTGVTPGSTGEK